MISGGFELTKLTYTRLQDNLIRHRGDRLSNCLAGALPYSHYVMRSFPLCAELGFSTPHNMIYCNSTTIMVTAKKKKGTLVA